MGGMYRPGTLEELGAGVRAAREAKGLSLEALARETGISKPYLADIERGRGPGPASAEKLAALEGVLGFGEGELVAAGDWLRTPAAVRALVEQAERLAKGGAGGAGGGESGGEDLPRRADGAIDLDAVVGRKGKAETPPVGGLPAVGEMGVAMVPVINKVAAGAAREFTDLDYPAGVGDQYVPVPELPGGEAPAGVFAVVVSGDSMEPEYMAGDVVVVGGGAVKDGDVCIVRLGEMEGYAQTLKRVEFVGEDRVRLVPLNGKHAAREVGLGEVTGMYRVRWKMRAV